MGSHAVMDGVLAPQATSHSIEGQQLFKSPLLFFVMIRRSEFL
jgi:hypothetical protein